MKENRKVQLMSSIKNDNDKDKLLKISEKENMRRKLISPHQVDYFNLGERNVTAFRNSNILNTYQVYIS